MNWELNNLELLEVQDLYGRPFDRIFVKQYLKWWERFNEKPYKGCGTCMEAVYDEIKIALMRNDWL